MSQQKALVPRASSPQAALAKLKPTIDAARAFRSAAKSEATRRAYATQWRLFVEWCDAHLFVSLPAEPTTLVLYLTHLANTLNELVRRVQGQPPRKSIECRHGNVSTDDAPCLDCIAELDGT